MAVPFLESVAKAYASRYLDFSRLIFVFPSRRSCTFFLKNLTDQLGDRVTVMPEVMTMSDFVENVSGCVIADRIEMLFILYQAYVKILKKDGKKVVPEFDSFRRWGETAISDFNEIDMQIIDPDDIFKNVKDLKEISSNFLTEEQLKVMELFFGQVYDPEDIATSFWKNFNDSEESKLHSRFRLIWQVMAPLYYSFNEMLAEKGLVSSGGAYRCAVDILEGKSQLSLNADKIVFVGFNALTRSERRIMDALSLITSDDGESPVAEFFWDIPGPVIGDGNSVAGRYVVYNRNRWPSPEWSAPFLAESDISGMPDSIKVISVPSNSLQTKVVGDVLQDMMERIDSNDLEEAKVAVVLPDESLLIPMLYSLPDEVGDVNITMGYPLRLSGVSAFVSLLRRMQSGRRKSGNSVGFYYKDFEAVLSHPFSQALFGSGVAEVKQWIRKHHHAVVDVRDLRDISADMAELLSPLSDDSGYSEVGAWLDRLLSRVAEAIAESDQLMLKSNVDVANVTFYRKTLKRVLNLIGEYRVNMHWRTFMLLVDRLIAPEKVPFEGQPLRGLQVMGMLETRALDFDRLVIPSLNERILPARRRVHTFISDSLRKAYGLPPVNYSESIFAYYFFRMIARAKEVVLLYDARSSEGARSGDVSRYVLQLQYLYAKDRLKVESRSFDISKSDLKPSEIIKTPEIMKMLSKFTDIGDGGKNLSATALSRFADCEIRFYFEHLLGIRTDEESVDYIDAITQGSILHFVMQNIYLPENLQGQYLAYPQKIDAPLVQALIKNVAEIDRLIRVGVNRFFFHRPVDKYDTPLRGSVAFVAKVFRSQILRILEFDLRQTPFLLYGVEIDGDVRIARSNGDPVNMRFAIDRIDLVTVAEKDKTSGKLIKNDRLRIVDYKTGTPHVESDSIHNVFSGDMKGRNLLQLWLYANLFDALPDKNVPKGGPRPLLKLFGNDSGLPSQPMTLEIYDVNNMKSVRHTYPVVGNTECTVHSELNSEFLEELDNMLDRLFDPEQPFMPASDLKSCSFCPFKTICWR